MRGEMNLCGGVPCAHGGQVADLPIHGGVNLLQTRRVRQRNPGALDAGGGRRRAGFRGRAAKIGLEARAPA